MVSAKSRVPSIPDLGYGRNRNSIAGYDPAGRRDGMVLTKTAPPTVEQLDHELAKLSIEGYWNTIGVSPPEPKPRADAHLWPWKDIYENLFKVSEVVNLEDGAERRSLRLC